MNGGGPVLANAWTMFPPTTTRKTSMAARSSKPRRRGIAVWYPSRRANRRAPMVSAATQKTNADHV